MGQIRSVVLTEAKTMYAGGNQGTAFLQIHTMNYDTGTGLYSQTSWVTNAGLTFTISKLVYEDGATSYLYYLKSSGTFTLNRLDITLPLTDTTTLASRGLVSSPTLSHQRSDAIWFKNGYVIVYGHLSSDMQFVDKTTMALTTTLTGSVVAVFFTLDNLDVNLLFAVSDNSPYGLYRIPIPASGAYAHTHSVVSASAINSNILNFGPYQYIGLVRTDLNPRTFEMYKKADLSVVGVPVNNQMLPTVMLYTLVQGPSEGNKFFLAYQYESAAYNFQSYYILFDMCVGRNAGTRICTTCPAGYYLNTANVADNDCYEEGRGKRSGTQALVPCADTNCLECPTSSTICRKCKQTPTQYWSQGTDPTTCVTTPPAPRFGIDATTFLYVACSDPNCLNCAASNTVCTGCDVAFAGAGGGWYLDGTTCKQKASFAPNQGVNGGVVATCTETNCIDCKSDYQTCTSCYVAGGFYLDGTVCKNQAMLAANQGKVTKTE